MKLEATCLHSNPADCCDPGYWIDWATDDLAYHVLGDVRWPDDAPPACLEALAGDFRQRLERSRGLVQLIESSADAMELEQALRLFAEAFLRKHYPEIELRSQPEPQGIELREAARCEAAAEVLRIAAGIVGATSREASTLLARCAEKERDCATKERGRIEARKAEPTQQIIAAVGYLLDTDAAPAARSDIAADLVWCLLDETPSPRQIGAQLELHDLS